MATIKFNSVVRRENDYLVSISLVENRTVDGERVEVPCGESIFPLPLGLALAEYRTRIIDRAQQIMDSHKDAMEKRALIDQAVWPEIT